MKVLESGRAQQGYAVEQTCTGEGNSGGGCGARLLVEEGDMRYYKGTDHIIYRPAAVSFRCSCCGVVTDMDRTVWPPRWSSLTPFTTAWSRGETERDWR